MVRRVAMNEMKQDVRRRDATSVLCFVPQACHVKGIPFIDDRVTVHRPFLSVLRT